MATDAKDKKFVGDYLKNNPDFVKSWVLRNVDLGELKSWVEADELTKTVGSGGAGTSTNMFKDFVSGKRPASRAVVRRSKEELLGMNQLDLFMELIRDITNELDVNALCHKILVNVGILTHGDRGSLFLSKNVRGKWYLVSKLFDVSETSDLCDVLHTDSQQILVPFGVGIAGSVAENKEQINIKDAYKDSRFNKAVDKKTGYITKSILCRPIFNYDGEVLGVAQIMNKTDGSAEFTAEDEKVFKNYLSFCGIGLANAQLFEMSVLEYKRNQLLLRLAQNIFEVQSNLDDLIRKIILDAQQMLKAERCSVWLVAEPASPQLPIEYSLLSDKHSEYNKIQALLRQDGDSFAKHQEALAKLQGTSKEPRRVLQKGDVIFDRVYEHHAGSQGDIKTPSIKEVSSSQVAIIAVDVAISGEAHNIADARLDDRFMKEISTSDGAKVISMLSVPIKNGGGCIIGVVQLLNKDNEKPFNENDLNNLEAFAIFCGLGINNCQMYESVCKLMAKQQVALEVLSYHASASAEEAQVLMQSRILSNAEYKLDTYEFDDFPWSDDDTCRATLRMFLECGIHEEFNVPMDVLSRWILSVKKNYRPVTYHNWRHAFNVAQSMFTIIKSGNMSRFLSNLEIFGLIVACLCHDLDHRGTNNAFQSKAASPLATLYGTSTMEHHHFDQCIMILNSEGNNIFGNLDPESYKTVLKMVETSILSTDLALYFRKKDPFKKLVEQTTTVDWSIQVNKELLRGMMMTACDVAAITKPWDVQIRVAHLVADEFFEQGDFERTKLGVDPIAMMDRQKQDELPKMQVGFIDAICLPLYQMLAGVEQGTTPLLTGAAENRKMWQTLADNAGTAVEGTNESKKSKPKEAARSNKVAPISTSPSRVSNGSIKSSGKKTNSQLCTLL